MIIVIEKNCLGRYSLLFDITYTHANYIVLNFAILQTNNVSLTNNTELNEPECNALYASMRSNVPYNAWINGILRAQKQKTRTDCLANNSHRNLLSGLTVSRFHGYSYSAEYHSINHGRSWARGTSGEIIKSLPSTTYKRENCNGRCARGVVIRDNE
jgi:hypothetical protein